MTINWGHKLTLGIVVFMSFIFFLVYKATNVNYDLVSKEYYKDELAYQQVIDGTNRANKLSSSVQVQQQNNQISIQFPAEMKGKKVEGEILFYCATDAKKDKKFPVQLNENGTQLISVKEIAAAGYIVKINWQSENQDYYNQQSITVQ